MKYDDCPNLEKDGFRGFLLNSDNKNTAFIVLLGNEGNDFMTSSLAVSLKKDFNVSSLSLSLRQGEEKYTGLHSFPLEYVFKAVDYLKNKGFKKIGIIGVSMQASIAMASSSLDERIETTIAISTSDFISWGFYKDEKGREFPSGTSSVSFKNKDLPYLKAPLEKDDYWNKFLQDNKTYKEIHSREIFNLAEEKEIYENAFIDVNKIKGKLILIGSADDSMWDSARYIKRIEKRFLNKGSLILEAHIFKYGTHLLFPESQVKRALPIVGDLISLMYSSGRKNFKECTKTRKLVDDIIRNAINN